MVSQAFRKLWSIMPLRIISSLKHYSSFSSMTFLFIYFPKGTVSSMWWHSINACVMEWMLAKVKVEQKEQFLLLNVFLLVQWAFSSYFDISVSNIPLKSALSLVLSLETSCSSTTCFLIELTSTYLPHQMAPFPCLCLARIYKHISACPDWDMDGRIQGLGPCVSISRRDLNSLNELGRSVPLYHFALSSYLHSDFPSIQILCSRSCVSLSCFQNSSHIFHDPRNKAISELKGFL